MEKGTLKEGRIEYIHHESKEIRDVESLPPLLSFFSLFPFTCHKLCSHGIQWKIAQ